MNLLLNIIILTTWGVCMIGLLSRITNRHRRDFLQNQILEMNVKSLATLSNLPMFPKPQEEMSESLKMMIQNSGNHPEAQEIEPTDELVGVIFDGSIYPPEFDEDYED